jgi:hypothetical protein
MRVWTAHLRPGARPVLVRDGFSFWAFLLGPLWLAAQRAWIAAVLALAAWVLIVRLTAPPVSTVLVLGEMVLLGLSGRDLARWSLATPMPRWPACWIPAPTWPRCICAGAPRHEARVMRPPA